ncbi:hypothetical protein CEP10_16295 [Cylindrospermopsis raciborskii S07]|nr:P44/Msp2 family outer membrane protein [Cylindrospermopsis raciborskii]PNK00832.1 hypothetical protein CEP11_18560 [Cylindrospermopsis raciborskii S10]PNK02801.1 hypothetical protein CEP10_16295 [Cylindrospermopsis raciborskii S07]PNK14536.1 hypothetical protein CEP09_11890 [Cylindrospermopsis raciborskii S06]PNK16841.1 hypothetical protein CEP08_10865 [Cylindrospermopsis raciborskii S05]
MKFNPCFFLFTVVSSLGFVTSVEAEEISAKASDLKEVTTSNNKFHSLLSQGSTYDLSPTLPSRSYPAVYDEAEAVQYWYGSGSIGFITPSTLGYKRLGQKLGDIHLNNGFSFTGALGYQFYRLRAEVEIGNRSVTAKEDVFVNGKGSSPLNGDLRTTSILLNGYYELSRSKFRPYIGGGVGVGFISGKMSGITNDEKGTFVLDIGNTALAYQAKAGVQYQLARKSNIFAELNYLGLSGYEVNASSGSQRVKVNLDSLNNFGVSIGYRQGF